MKLRVFDWGLADFPEALKRQRELVCEVIAGKDPALAMCEHPSVITLGRKSFFENLLLQQDEIARRGIALCSVDRGGDVSLHAPGQLVIYPIVPLDTAARDLRRYLRKLEQVAIDFLKEFDILASGDDDRRGVWVGKRKIASIGIGVRRWVTYHGMALNINTDLQLFHMIRPCGLDVRMTSVEELLGHALDMTDAKASLKKHFLDVFGMEEFSQ